MEAWSKWSNPKAAKRAEDLLSALERNYDRMLDDAEYSSALLPNAYSYNHVCHAYVQSKGGSKSAQRAEEVLERMLDRCEIYMKKKYHGSSQGTKNIPPPPEPLISTFNTVINAWAKSQDNHAGTKSEQVFRKMELWNYHCKEASSSVYNGVIANAISLASVLDAWASTASKRDDSFDRILGIFHHAVDKLRSNRRDNSQHPDESEHSHHKSSDTPTIALNTVALNSILNGLANSKKGLQAAEKAHEVFAIMEELHESGVLKDVLHDVEGMDMNTEPDSITWSLLLKCWADAVKGPSGRTNEFAAEQCETILHHMEELHSRGENIKPNVVTYTSCITAWSKCKSEKGALHALSILERMEDLHLSTGFVQPNHIHYNACLSALCLAGTDNAFQKAKTLLTKMQDNDLVDTSSYNTMMKAYLEHHPQEARTQIQKLSEKMKDDDIPMDRITYITMMDVFTKGGADEKDIQKVIALLETMIHQCKLDSRITPDALTFTKVINAIAKSRIAEKADPARRIFHQMISLHEARMDDAIKPDSRVFSAFISACANQGDLQSDERKRFALKLALGAYEQLCKSPEYGAPNAFIYGGLLKACGRLSAEKNQKGRLIQHVFQKCKEDGQVSRGVMDIFLRSCPNHLKEKFLDGYDDRRLPPEWFRNVTVDARPN